MGNCCDCLFGKSDESNDYTPILMQEISQQRGRPVENVTNNYQTIIDKASINFITTKYFFKNDGSSNNNSNDIEIMRTKFSKANMDANIIASPPNTGLRYQSYQNYQVNKDKMNYNEYQLKSNENNSQNDQNLINKFYYDINQNNSLENIADNIANEINLKTNYINNDNKRNAVISFKPFENTMHSS